MYAKNQSLCLSPIQSLILSVILNIKCLQEASSLENGGNINGNISLISLLWLHFFSPTILHISVMQ